MREFPIPPITFAAGLVTQYLLAHRRAVTPTSIGAAAVVATASGWLLAGTAREFRRQRTTFDPVDVSAARFLVVRGPNRLTRNPMYVGLAGLLVAHAVLRRSAVAVLPVAAFVEVIDRFQVPGEEDALLAKFDDAYDRYRRSVPRWLGRRSARKT